MSFNHEKIVKQVAAEVRKKMEGESSGHDWWHIVRVWNMAKWIGAKEGADMFTVELAALLHDIADWKFHDGDDTVGPKTTKKILKRYSVSDKIANHVCDIVAHISFKGAGVKNKIKTLEGRVMQDADRLDAIGAIGIARAFAYGGHKNRLMHHPDLKPILHKTKKAYFKNQGTIDPISKYPPSRV